ncbi:NAD(P)/FAD-dependent oxidoreductase, partial [Halorubrum sp. SD626R]
LDPDRLVLAFEIEYEMEGVEMNHPEYADLRRAMMLRLDHDFAPGGYSWIFATGEDTAKVGICYIQNDRHREFADEGQTVDGYLNEWVDSDPRFADAEQIDGKVHRGSAHIQMPDEMHTDRFLAIGDTVPTIDPLWGEGIHKGMKSARAAAATVDRCLTDSERRLDAESLAVYERLWHRDVAPRMKARLMLTRLLYLAPNERYDRFMR